MDRIDRWQRRHGWAALVVAVARKYGEDGAARNAARVSYYAFFSIFPLLLVLVSVLGFVLHGQPDLREQILESAYADMPVIGPFVRGDVGSIEGSGLALVAGIATALWAGLGVTVALGQAFDEIWITPRGEQPGFLSRRAHGAALLLLAGTGIVAGSVLGGAAVGGHAGATAETVAALLVSIAVDAAALLAAFVLLTAAGPPLRALLPGIAVGTAGLLVLQALGGWYVNAAIARATDTYGLFATVIGMLSWLSLAAQLLLVAAEVNAVRFLGLSPRSLAGEATPADVRAAERYAAR
jgi:uncharacterized BrkB/YihY/UPF0761 family membrane protein